MSIKSENVTKGILILCMKLTKISLIKFRWNYFNHQQCSRAGTRTRTRDSIAISK